MNCKETGVGSQKVAPARPKSSRRKGERLRLPPEIDPELTAVLLFTKRQMAAMLQVSTRTLDYLMQRGEVSYLKLNGKLVRFRVEDVLRRLNEVALVAEPEAGEAGGEGGYGAGTQLGGSTLAGTDNSSIKAERELRPTTNKR